MYAKGRKKGTVRFAFRPERVAGEVRVAGSFNAWRPEPMRRQRDGTYVRIVPVGEEAFEYKFVVDGDWRTDPDNAEYAANPFGTVNSAGAVG